MQTFSYALFDGFSVEQKNVLAASYTPVLSELSGLC